MKNGQPNTAEIIALKKAKKICDEVSKWQREHPRTLNPGLHYVSTDAARAIETLITMLQG